MREASAISGCRQSPRHRTAPQLRTPCRGPPWRKRTSSPNFSSGGSPGAAGHVRPRGRGQRAGAGAAAAAALRGVSVGAPLSSPPARWRRGPSAGRRLARERPVGGAVEVLLVAE